VQQGSDPFEDRSDSAHREERALAEVAEAVVWRGAHLRESRWAFEAARLFADPVWRGIGVPRGDGSPVLLIPGFLAGDSSLTIMARWLKRLGYRPRRAGIVFNARCSDVAVDRLAAGLARISLQTGSRVAVVGHSRGGLFARALAARSPEQVSRVVALGSPLEDPLAVSRATLRAVDGVRRQIARRDPERAARGCFTASCTCRYAADAERPWPDGVPFTSVYSRGDGVVRWQACLAPYAECVEVRGSHVGLAMNRHAYGVIGRALAGS
jgi:triacylglycerol lipase